MTEEMGNLGTDTLNGAEKNYSIPERVPLGGPGCTLLALCFAAALTYSFGHNWFDLTGFGPGIGLTISHLALTAAVLLAAKKQKRLRSSRTGIFLLVLSVLLSAAYAVFANVPMRRMNLPVLCLVTAQALFALTGANQAYALSGEGLWEGSRRYADSLVRWWKTPFTSLARIKGNRKGAWRNLFPGLMAALAASLAAAFILSTADQVFSGILQGAADRAARVNGVFVLRLLLAPALALVLFSHRFSVLRSPKEIPAPSPRVSDATVFCLVLAGLSLVYALFGYVQIRYLFAGVESVRMSGGYAAYARSGFFQLVLVALLTLGVILPALTLFGDNRAVRLLCALTSLLTAVIDASAFVRMRLYTEAYGLSTLRVVTLWGIGVIMVALLAVIAKTVWSGWKICPVLAAVILTSWVLLNWVNVDRVVANDLVSRFNAGAEGTASVQSLASDQYWSPDYYSAFLNIADPSSRREAFLMLDERANEERSGRRMKDPPVYDWSLAWLRGRDTDRDRDGNGE